MCFRETENTTFSDGETGYTDFFFSKVRTAGTDDIEVAITNVQTKYDQ